MGTAHPLPAQPGMSNENRLPWIYRAGFWICIVIAVAVAVRRILAPLLPSRSAQPQLANLDAAFASHRVQTLAHVVPALLFVLLLPLIFSKRFHDHPSQLSIWIERVWFLLGLVVGITAYGMSVDAVGGWIERSAVLFYNSAFLFSLLRAVVFERNNAVQQRLWRFRAVAILLGIATTRPVMGIFFATSSRTHLGPPQFFGIAFWIGFSINALAIELWIRRRKQKILAGAGEDFSE